MKHFISAAAEKYVHLYNIFSDISRAFENHLSCKPGLSRWVDAIRNWNLRGLEGWRCEDRVSFHSLKGHQNAIVLSLENITSETIRDNCVLATLRFAVVTEWRLCVNSSDDGLTLYGPSKSTPPIDYITAFPGRKMSATCMYIFLKKYRSFNRSCRVSVIDGVVYRTYIAYTRNLINSSHRFHRLTF